MSRTTICSTCRAPSGLCRCSESGGRVLSAEEIARIPASRSERFVMWPDRDHGGIQVADVLTTLAHRTAPIAEVYERFKHLDRVLSDNRSQVLSALWTAVKRAMEGTDGQVS